MMSGFKRTQRDYPLSFKIAVVEKVEKGEMTYKQAGCSYGIQGRSTVLVWLRKYGRLDWSPGLPDQVKRRLPVALATVPLTPEQRIRELEEQLEQASQKTEFFNYLSITCSMTNGYNCHQNAQAEWINGILKMSAYFHERRSLNNFHRDRVITFEQIAE
ncbi:hypothetical protein RNN08_23980, partial [Escherichia coli]|nr:transposase [Escherichia coli]MDT1403796.1 hypothetical protein [Escherichia coli]